MFSGSKVFISAMGQSYRKGRSWEDLNRKVCIKKTVLISLFSVKPADI